MSIERNVFLNIEDNSITLDQDLIFYTGNNDVILNMVFPKTKYATGSHIPTKYTVLCLTPDNQIETTIPDLIVQNGDNYELAYQLKNDIVGIYKLQIVLMDNYSHIRLPEIKYQVIRGIDGLVETQFDRNSEVGQLVVGEGIAAEGGETTEYVSHKWYTGDVVTSSKLNNMMNGIDQALSTTWDNLGGKPPLFPPTGHTHLKSDISDFAHTHTKSQITDFPTNLSQFVNDIGAGGIELAHSHTNLTVLESLTQEKFNEWESKPSKTEFNNLDNYSHELENMILDNQTLTETLQTEIENARMGNANLGETIADIDSIASEGLLKANTNTSQLNGFTISVLTQAEYDLISVKDNNTLYFIKEV